MSQTEALLSNQEAEQSVLGALLIDPAAISKVLTTLYPGDFWVKRNEWVYQAILDLHHAGTPVDPVTLADRLEATGQLKELGGAAYLAELFTATPTSLHVVHYANIVSRLATSRKLVQAATRIAQLAHDQNNDLDAVFAQARSLIDSVAPLDLGRAVLFWQDALSWYLDRQGERTEEVEAQASGEQLERLTFPWMALRERVSWIRPGMIVLVGAESGVGKTMFLECCAEEWAKQGYRVVFFHFELSHQVMLDRLMCRQAGVPMAELETGALDNRVTETVAELYDWIGRINYVHCPGWPMSRVVGTARQLAAKGECDVIMVDYLQKAYLPAKTAGLTPAQVRGQQVEVLKTLAEQMEMPILLTSQLNRTSQQYGRKVRFSIRDTGEADEKANVVLLLDREILDADATMEYDLDEHRRVTVEAECGELSPILKVRCDKNTLGRTGDDELLMDPSRFWIMDKANVAQRPLSWDRSATMEAL